MIWLLKNNQNSNPIQHKEITGQKLSNNNNLSYINNQISDEIIKNNRPSTKEHH